MHIQLSAGEGESEREVPEPRKLWCNTVHLLLLLRRSALTTLAICSDVMHILSDAHSARSSATQALEGSPAGPP